MSEHDPSTRRNLFRFSLDAWAVTAAFTLALLVRLGVLKHIPW